MTRLSGVALAAEGAMVGESNHFGCLESLDGFSLKKEERGSEIWCFPTLTAVLLPEDVDVESLKVLSRPGCLRVEGLN